MRLLMVTLALLTGTAFAGPRVECTPAGGMVHGAEDVDYVLVSVDGEVFTIDLREGAEFGPDEFCALVDIRVAFVLPIPHPNPDRPEFDAHAPGPEHRWKAGAGIDGFEPEDRFVAVKDERPRPELSTLFRGADQSFDFGAMEEPAPVPAEPADPVSEPAPLPAREAYGCSAAPSAPALPLIAVLPLLALALRRRR